MAGDVGLPRYLRHVAAGAWFEPITLLAGFPAKVSEAASDEEKIAFIHEQAHYLQAISTLFGATRFFTLWQSLTGLASLHTRSRLRGGSSLDARDRLRAEHLDRRRMIEDMAIPELLDVSDTLEGVHVVDTGERSLIVFAKPTPEGARLFPLGAHALQESMAMAIERALGHSAHHYEYARRDDGFAFAYAAAHEAVRAVLGDSDDLFWITVALCDIALDSLVPQHAFYRGLQRLALEYREAPSRGALRDVHELARGAAQIAEVDEHREQLLHELADVAQRGRDSDDPFDRAFAKLFVTILDAFELRGKRPAALVEGLLDPGGKIALMERFLTPCYRVGDQLLTFSDDAELVNAIIFLLIGDHTLRVTLGETREVSCPLRDLAHCTFARVEECSRAPWFRAEEEGGACACRFVAHALAHGSSG